MSTPPPQRLAPRRLFDAPGPDQPSDGGLEDILVPVEIFAQAATADGGPIGGECRDQGLRIDALQGGDGEWTCRSRLGWTLLDPFRPADPQAAAAVALGAYLNAVGEAFVQSADVAVVAKAAESSVAYQDESRPAA